MGSGSAGLMCALTAASEGLSVLVVEKAEKLGGTTAWSAAAIYAPANHVAAQAGLSDSPAEAEAYLLATAPPGWAESDGRRLAAFARTAGAALRLIEEETPLRFQLLPDADLFPDAPGAKPLGRMLTPGLVRRSVVGGWARRIRRPKLPMLFTFAEVVERDPLTAGPLALLGQLPVLAKRLLAGQRGMGTALVTGLLKGCLDHGCTILTGARITGLDQGPDGDIRGVTAMVAGTPRRFRARCGVVIASGGFEWNDALIAEHFPGPVDYRASPPTNEGDGLALALAAGAEVDRMDQANFNSAIPGRIDGKRQGLGWFYHVAPNAVIVNGQGERFVNEHDHNLGLLLDKRNQAGQPVNLPAWFIADARFLARNRIARLVAGRESEWITHAPTLGGLARKIAVDPETLGRTVDAFNAGIDEGLADRFGRTRREKIVKPPFVALTFNRTFISTKGGPRTDERARVLRADGSAILGLYCVGVAMACPIGTKAVSTGTTLGPNLAWGYIAGRDAAARKRIGQDGADPATPQARA